MVTLCRHLTPFLDGTWVSLTWAWWSVSITLSLGLLSFTVTKARIKAKEINLGRRPSESSEESEEDPRRQSLKLLSSMYQRRPRGE